MYIDGYTAHEAERAVLTLLVREYERNRGLVSRLESSDFIDDQNRTTFLTIERQVEAGKMVDLVTLSALLPDDMDYLIGLSTNFALTAMADDYVATIKEAATRRKLYHIGKRLVDSAKSGDVEGVADEARKSLLGINVASEETLEITDNIWHVHERIYDDKPKSGIQMGLEKLDHELNGFLPDTMYIIGARPSVGKSVFGMLAAIAAGKAGKKALIINREMAKEAIVTRMLAHLSGIDIQKIRRCTLDMAEKETLAAINCELDSLEIRIANTPKTPAQIRDTAMRCAENDGLDLVVVDYLQRLTSGQRTHNRDEEIGRITWALKDLAMDLHVPVILLSQLNRDAANKRPSMANLRESGNAEQDADSVILLHRPNRDDLSGKGVALYDLCKSKGGEMLEIILDKNREGQTCILPVMFHGATMSYIGL